jgi:hypothetical protein
VRELPTVFYACLCVCVEFVTICDRQSGHQSHVGALLVSYRALNVRAPTKMCAHGYIAGSTRAGRCSSSALLSAASTAGVRVRAITRCTPCEHTHTHSAKRAFSAVIGRQALCDCVERFGATNPYTCLVVKLDGIDPDDAFSSVPYEKACDI